MKNLMFTLALLLPLMARGEEKNVLAGQYAGCAVSLESLSEAPKSNFYVFTFGEDSSLDLVKESYDGTEKCDNQPARKVEYKHFVVLDDTGPGYGRWITAQEMGTKLFFKFVIAKSYAAIDSSPNYPVKTDLVDLMVLDKMQ